MRIPKSFAKLVVAYLILQTVFTASMAIVAHWQTQALSNEQMERLLQSCSNALLPPVQTYFLSSETDSTVLAKLCERLNNDKTVRVTIVNADGVVLYDTYSDPATLQNHADRPEIIEASKSGLGTSTRTSESVNEQFYYRAVRISDPDPSVEKSLGFLRLAMETEPVQSRTRKLSQSFITFLILSLVSATAVLLWVGSRTMQPMTALMSFSNSVARGEYNSQLNHHQWSQDWQTLGGAFDSMKTELSRRESELRENGERLAAVLAGMTEGILAVDRNQRVLFANRAASILLEISFQDLTHRSIDELAGIQSLKKAIEKTFDSHRLCTEEIEIQVQPKRILDVRITWLAQSMGEVVVIVLDDVTNVRQLETMRRDFVANVSHELKTPLSSIKAYSETLRMGAIEDANVRLHFVERIEEQTKRLNDLIMDLIQLAHIESGLAAFELDNVNLVKVAIDRIKYFEVESAKRQLQLSFESDETDILVRCDVSGLVTILDNLISNAVKYTPVSGKVRVHCKIDESRQFGVLEVTDNGLGIAPEHQERVFERFYRVDKARSNDISGTGLGLSIVKHLTQAFSGQVSLVSRLGQGSTFRVLLPLSDIHRKTNHTK